MPDFLSDNLISILNGVAIGSLLFTIAVGLSLVFGLMNVLNLAHGAVFLIGAALAFEIANGSNASFALAVLVAAAVGSVLGGGLSVALIPIRDRGHLDQVLLTLGIAFVLINGSSALWGDDFRSVPAPAALQGSTEILGKQYPTYRLAVIVAGLVIAGAVYLLVERTRIGAVVRATVDDRDMAEALGINTRLVAGAGLAVGSALAAAGGVIGAPILSIRPGLEWEVLILALIVVVVGGLGSVTGALVGALLIGQVQSLGVALVPQLAPFLLFGVMALVLVLRPDGLFAKAAAR